MNFRLNYKMITIFVLIVLNVSLFTTIHPLKGAITSCEYELSSFPGYTLFSPEYDTKTYLINNNGSIVNMWQSNNIQALGTYLLPNGNLIRSCNKIPNIFFPYGGFTGRIEMFDWNGTRIWEFEYNNNSVLLHHDIEVLPNGNILMIAWEIIDYDDALSSGVNMESIAANHIVLDHIIEVEPIYPSGGNIVWEWHVIDHIIQDYDTSKKNYANIADHPELIDINYVSKIDEYYLSHIEKTHINSIDYNKELDQILISSRHYNEIWIIDHGTTTDEASRHIGGRYGKGGDLLYRWGNPKTYDHGSDLDQQLFRQHDASWIAETCPTSGNILVFNNGDLHKEVLYSSILELQPPLANDGSYSIDSMVYGPSTPIWKYTAEPKTDFFAYHLSSAQRLANNNTLICYGGLGYFFEITSDNEIVWEYDLTQTDINLLKYDTFKVRRYSLNYQGIKTLHYQRPTKPSIPEGNNELKTGLKYSFKTYSSDPNEDLLSYRFDWGDNTTSRWIGSFQSGKTAEASHSWHDIGEYQIRVKCRDSYGFESEWSDPLIVSINYYQTWLFGRIDEQTIQQDEISFWAEPLFKLSFHPFHYEYYPLGTHMRVTIDYMGILTKNIIAGRFYLVG